MCIYIIQFSKRGQQGEKVRANDVIHYTLKKNVEMKSMKFKVSKHAFKETKTLITQIRSEHTVHITKHYTAVYK